MSDAATATAHRPDCLACALSAAQRENAILRVPKTIPNPEYLECVALGKDPFFRVWHDQRTPAGKWIRVQAVIPIPKTLPNPTFDRETRTALDMPMRCALHEEMARLERENRLLKAQEMGEEIAKLAKKLDVACVVGLPLGNRKAAPLQGEVERPALKGFAVERNRTEPHLDMVAVQWEHRMESVLPTGQAALERKAWAERQLQQAEAEEAAELRAEEIRRALGR